MINDPIADMLIRIKNGYMARKEAVLVPRSKFKAAIITVLKKYHYIGEVAEADSAFTVKLLYQSGKPAMTQVQRISKPGLRRYMSVKDLEGVRHGLGFLILSTPKGIMTHIDAKKQRIGGEVICKIW